MPSATHIGNYHLAAALFTIDMPITHRQVELFQAVMRAGSLGAAAQGLHSSQPTLSRELSRLEQRLGYALFERSPGSRLKPTAAASALFDSVQRHYEGLARVQAHARQLARAEAGELRLLALPALAHGLLPAALAAARPARAVHITPAESPQLESWMAEQGHDLGVAEARGPISGCSVQALPELAEVAVLPAGHPLLARRQLSAADFAEQDFVSLADDDPYRAAIDAQLAGVPRSLRWQTASSVAACALVQQGLGLAIVNPLTALACAGPSLHWRPLAFRIPYRLAVLRPLQRPASRDATQLAESLALTVQQLALRLASDNA